MKETVSERHMAENEVMFRQHNQQIQHGLEKLAKTTSKQDRQLLGENLDIPLHFLCECSDEKCDKRVIVKPSEYKAVHKNRSQFLILPGHMVAAIEKIVLEKPNYMVIEKYKAPPKKATKLNPTNIKNT